MKRKTWWYVAGGVGAVLVLIQFIPAAPTTNPPVTGEIQASAEVMEILRTSCYDCHSHETEWPWYSRVAPSKWLVRHDVAEGREHVNFSVWSGYDTDDADHALEEMLEVLEEGEMPLWYYTPLHPSATLSDDERATLVTWAESRRAELASGTAEPELR